MSYAAIAGVKNSECSCAWSCCGNVKRLASRDFHAMTRLMSRIHPCPLPQTSLLLRYAGGGGHTDCYRVALPGAVTLPTYVEAFYTTPLFKMERLLLRLVSRGSTDAEARQLARGERKDFAAWMVEARADDQLLLCDYLGRTRSWLMVAAFEDGSALASWLYFGSAVVPVRSGSSAAPTLGAGFNALLGLHRVYSLALLGAARRGLLARRSTTAS
jgi:hypothetical protein